MRQSRSLRLHRALLKRRRFGAIEASTSARACLSRPHVLRRLPVSDAADCLRIGRRSEARLPQKAVVSTQVTVLLLLLGHARGPGGTLQRLPDECSRPPSGSAKARGTEYLVTARNAVLCSPSGLGTIRGLEQRALLERTDLPDSVQHALPQHARRFRQAFNPPWDASLAWPWRP